jgi:hypothetical protein
MHKIWAVLFGIVVQIRTAYGGAAPTNPDQAMKHSLYECCVINAW